MDLEVVGSRPTCRPNSKPVKHLSFYRESKWSLTHLSHSVTKTLDDNTSASNPGGVRLSRAKLKILQPDLYGPFAWFGWYLVDKKIMSRRSFWLTRIEEQLLYGDSRAAVVVSTSPLLVAAYTDEIDCVALLRFHDRFVSEYNLERGSRLITVNTYEFGDGSYEVDLKPGPEAMNFYQNFTPFIADFFTNDLDRLNERKAEITEEEWQRTEEMGQSYLSKKYAPPRDGRPLWCSLPAKQLPDDFPSLDPPKPEPVSILEVVKTISFVVAFTLLLLWVLADKRASRRTVLLALGVFGTMLVISLIQLFRLPTEIDTSINIKRTAKAAYMTIGVFAVSLLYALGWEMIFGGLSGFWPNLAICLSTFITTLALYPFRGEMKKDFPTLPLWAIYSSVCGLLGIAIAQLSNWLARG